MRRKVLNLYSGLGGNRTFWEDVDVTAVEMDESIAKFYKDRFPEDKVVVGDAHQYLLNNYMDFDFIWASPPCPTHSRARYWSSKGNPKIEPKYPDMSVYQEIIYLQNYFNGKWVVENVIPYYKPLISPSVKIGRHLFWANFQIIPPKSFKEADIKNGSRKEWEELHGISIGGYRFNQRTDKILRNCVQPDLGKHIFEESKREGMFNLSFY